MPVVPDMSNDAVIPFLQSTQTVALITTRTDGSEVATPIWAVAVDGVGYVRSYLGADVGWFRRAASGRPAWFSLEDGTIAEKDAATALTTRRAAVTVDVVDGDDPVHDQISAEYRAKYARWPQDLAPMVVEPAVGATLRVVPAENP
jgi:hypothetical protein